MFKVFQSLAETMCILFSDVNENRLFVSYHLPLSTYNTWPEIKQDLASEKIRLEKTDIPPWRFNSNLAHTLI